MFVQIFIFVVILLILSFILEYYLRGRLNIKKREGLLYSHVNNVHRIGETVLVIIGLAIVFTAIMRDWDYEIGYFFIYLFVLFAFRTIMEWYYDRKGKQYILTFLTVIMLTISYFFVVVVL